MIGQLGRGATVALLFHSALIQALTFLIRPAATYRALELDVPDYALGALAASYAVVPLLLAIPTGGLVDRLGEKRLILAGSLVVLSSAVFLLFYGTSSSEAPCWARGSSPAWWASRRWWPTTPSPRDLIRASGTLPSPRPWARPQARWPYR